MWQGLAWYAKLDAVPFLVGLGTLILYSWVKFLSVSVCVVLLPLYVIFVTAVALIIDTMQINIISHYFFLIHVRGTIYFPHVYWSHSLSSETYIL